METLTCQTPNRVKLVLMIREPLKELVNPRHVNLTQWELPQTATDSLASLGSLPSPKDVKHGQSEILTRMGPRSILEARTEKNSPCIGKKKQCNNARYGND